MYDILHAATGAATETGIPGEVYTAIGGLLIAIIAWLFGKKTGSKK